ncbi:MAG: hypothetical protein Ct9H300mP1_16070 [Planctomycetaceae bacterium]|nr:MAG: hypothetical protein Ct9H300mP1_16070 [Planctomycetaceae bacterium]
MGGPAQKFPGTLPPGYWIEVAEKAGEWREVAGIADRPPFGSSNTAPADVWLAVTQPRSRPGSWTPGADQQSDHTLDGLAKGPTAYVGRFDPPPVTHRLYRGDPQAPRRPLLPAPDDSRRSAHGHERTRTGPSVETRPLAGPPDNPLTPR